MARALLFAFAPMLFYFGHWQISVPLPGLDAHLDLGAGEASAQESGDQHGHSHEDHSEHCHGDASACGNLPVMGVSGFALLDQHLRAPAFDEHAWPAATALWRPHAPLLHLPEIPPPRTPNAA